MSDSSHPLHLLLRKLENHSPLGEVDRQALLAIPFTQKTLEPHSYLTRDGDEPSHCGVLLSGFAFRHKLTGDGARQIVALHIPGDALDFQHLFLKVADHNVQTLTRAEVAIIPRQSLQELLLSNRAISHAISVSNLIEASLFREWVLNVGRRRGRERLAHVLCEFAVRLVSRGLADEYGYTLPMNQEELGDVLGLSPVHVNRTLKGLEAEGLITRDKRHVSFPDWQRLREAGDFNSRYLHLEPQIGRRT